jgi:hypothetical protein
MATTPAKKKRAPSKKAPAQKTIPRTARKTRALGVSFATACRLARALRDVDDRATSYGTPALKVRGKLMARLLEDGETLVVRIGFADRTAALEADPRAYFLTDHYLRYPWILVRLPKVREAALAALLEGAHRLAAPKSFYP